MPELLATALGVILMTWGMVALWWLVFQHERLSIRCIALPWWIGLIGGTSIASQVICGSANHCERGSQLMRNTGHEIHLRLCHRLRPTGKTNQRSNRSKDQEQKTRRKSDIAAAGLDNDRFQRARMMCTRNCQRPWPESDTAEPERSGVRSGEGGGAGGPPGP